VRLSRPTLLGIDYASHARPVVEAWREEAASGSGGAAQDARARLKSLATFEFRVRGHPLGAGDIVARDRWPRDLSRDYGDDIGNLFRFEISGRWRGYYALVGEDRGVRVWVLYLWDHATYDRQSRYARK